MASSLPATMRAWQYSRFGGGADALELATDVAVPTAGKGEVVVKVQAASVNPVDWKLQSGALRPLLPPKLPWIPGIDIAGEIVSVGADAGSFATGDQVFAMENMKHGGFGEYARLSSTGTARRPAAVPPATASCLGVAAVTALQALRDSAGVPMGATVTGFADSGGAAAGSSGASAASAEGKRVLVANASGGVGHYAVQLAKLAGAHVTATCGARNADFVKSLGADEVLDYKTPEGQALKAPSQEPYDAIIDGTGSPGLSWKVVEPALKPGGRWVHLTPNVSVFGLAALHAATFSTKRCVPMIASARADDLSALGRLAAEGRLKTHIHAEVPLESAPEAWKKSMEGHVVGKVVVAVSSPS